MCSSSCGFLYKPGQPLQEVTCPCGRGYWDVWKVAFVTGDMIRSGHAPPKEEHVAEVKKKLSPERYEAEIRLQYIRHFLDCAIKRALDDKVTDEGNNDGTSLHRAIAEWSEITNGDYKSKGTSQQFDVRRLQDMWSKLSGSPKTDKDIRPLLLRAAAEEKREVGAFKSPPAQSTRTSQVAGGPHSPYSDQPSPLPVDRNVRSAGTPYFVPGEDLRYDVLSRHCDKGTFGLGATVRPYAREVQPNTPFNST